MNCSCLETKVTQKPTLHKHFNVSAHFIDMIKLTEKQCDILDQILGRFDSNGYLQREEIYQISDNNEKLASSYIEVLVSNELVEKIGKIEGSDIPLKLLKKPKAEIFITNGGFAQLHRN